MRNLRDLEFDSVLLDSCKEHQLLLHEETLQLVSNSLFKHNGSLRGIPGTDLIANMHFGVRDVLLLSPHWRWQTKKIPEI